MASSKAMEELTFKMHDIAADTEKETMSMHVITFITMVFLPPTFVSVRISDTWRRSGKRLQTDNQPARHSSAAISSISGLDPTPASSATGF